MGRGEHQGVGEGSAWGNGHVGKLLRVRGSGSVAYEGGCEYLCEEEGERRRGRGGGWEGKVSRLAVRSGGVEGVPRQGEKRERDKW